LWVPRGCALAANLPDVIQMSKAALKQCRYKEGSLEQCPLMLCSHSAPPPLWILAVTGSYAQIGGGYVYGLAGQPIYQAPNTSKL
jgi:hypothetical protein